MSGDRNWHGGRFVVWALVGLGLLVLIGRAACWLAARRMP